MTLVIMALAAFEWHGGPYAFRNAELTSVKNGGWERLPFSLEKAGAMDADLVVLLGGSTSRELSPSDQFMTRELSRKCGKPIRFLNAGSSSQDLSESWAIADALPRERLALIVVGLNIQRLEHGPEETQRAFTGFRMPFRGASRLRAELDRRGMAPTHPFPPLQTTGWLLKRWANLTWSAQETLEQFATSADRYQIERNLYVRPVLTLEQKLAKVSRVVSERLPIYYDVHKASSELWAEFVRSFVTPRRHVLFLDLPVSKTLSLAKNLTHTQYNADMTALRAAGAQVEPLQGETLLEEDDFYDQQHIIESGRQKIATALISQLASAIPLCRIRS